MGKSLFFILLAGKYLFSQCPMKPFDIEWLWKPFRNNQRQGFSGYHDKSKKTINFHRHCSVAGKNPRKIILIRDMVKMKSMKLFMIKTNNSQNSFNLISCWVKIELLYRWYNMNLFCLSRVTHADPGKDFGENCKNNILSYSYIHIEGNVLMTENCVI